MKMVYCNENLFLVNNIKNLLEAQKIDVFLKNEYAQGAIGEISAFDAWPEVWVVNDYDLPVATEIVTLLQTRQNRTDWICKNCAEMNDSAFEICWQCQHENNVV